MWCRQHMCMVLWIKAQCFWQCCLCMYFAFISCLWRMRTCSLIAGWSCFCFPCACCLWCMFTFVNLRTIGCQPLMFPLVIWCTCVLRLFRLWVAHIFFVMHFFLLSYFRVAFALRFRSSVIIVGAVMFARLRLLELCASKFVVSHIRLLPMMHKSNCVHFLCAHIFGICGVHLDVVCVSCSLFARWRFAWS